MFIGNPPGNYDRILDFSTALTGNLFFVPSGDFLDDPPEPGAQPAPRAATLRRRPRSRAGPAATDGSLGIGGLRATTGSPGS